MRRAEVIVPPTDPFFAADTSVHGTDIDSNRDVDSHDSYLSRSTSSNSIMQNVHKRIYTMHQKTPQANCSRGDGDAQNFTNASPRSVAAAVVATSISHQKSLDKDEAEKGKRPRCSISFRIAVIAAITIAVVATCVGMLAPLEYFIRTGASVVLHWSKRAISTQREFINELVFVNVTNMSYRNTLRIEGTTVERFVRNPTDDAVSSLLTVLESYESFNMFGGLQDDARRKILQRSAWFILKSQLTSLQYSDKQYGGFKTSEGRTEHADWAYVAFASGQFAGSLVVSSDDGSQLYALDSPGDNKLYEFALNSTGGRNSTLTRVEDYVTRNRAYYEVQELIRNASNGSANKSATRAWSRLYEFALSGSLGLSWTAPMAHCGDYSCFEGVIASDITLASVNSDCTWQWKALQRELSSSVPPVYIGYSNSSIFIVNHVSARFPEQQGALVGVADAKAMRNLSILTFGNHSPQPVVKAASLALLKAFGSWDADQLHSEQLMQFDLGEMMTHGKLVNCTPNVSDNSVESNCQGIATTSVLLDEETRWLVVVTLPLLAFSKKAVVTARDVDSELDIQRRELNRSVRDLKVFEICIAFFITMLVILCGICFGTMISRPLKRLSTLMRRLSDLDFAYDSEEYLALRRGTFSWVTDISQLQGAYCRLLRGIEAFARFVPETVVRSIVRGDARATRLQVSRRNVTIMFTDIKDFTTITENLSQMDLLLLLTRYLSVMTHIVELYEGVVAEVLGDGLLVFWNTPDLIKDHAAKACAAALTQQSAVGFLNAEFASLGLPELAIRIGVHTGQVFTGNIGSETKMKFGCMGDPMNTASRLEGMCKVYGVDILCSGATRAALPAGYGFFTRKLDLVQLKGKREPVEIYEVIGRVENDLAATIDAKDSSAADLIPEDVETGREHVRDDVDGPIKPKPLVETPLAPGLRPSVSITLDALTRSTSKKSISGREFDSAPCSTNYPSVGMPGPLSQNAIPVARCDSTQCQSGKEITEERRALVRQYEKALASYQRAQFVKAQSLLEDLLNKAPHDVATSRLLRCTRQYTTSDGQGFICLSEEELKNWNGVAVMTDK